VSSNPEAEAFFTALSAHDDVASELRSALSKAKLGDCNVRCAPREYGAVFGVTADTVFCGAAGMATTYWRLSDADRAIALATGALKSTIGPEWVEVTLFRSDWPAPDLVHWGRCAYRYARTGR
jgi:hypothetical protein